MSFKSVFISVFIGVALIVAAIVLNLQRPAVDTNEPTAEFVKASGKCAECHRAETAAIVVEFEQSAHSAAGVNCIDCHRPLEGQESLDHRGFTITTDVTSGNCKQCHQTEYQQFNRSRHAAPAFAAVRGSEPFTEEQIEHAEKFHPGTVKRPANALAILEGEAATVAGCEGCHSIGKPNADGSIGNCTECHSRHLASIALARQPQTCGQCHLGPDHSQIEIFNQSKHGAIYHATKDRMNMDADPKELKVEDIFAPNCATCHMSGLEGMKVTHDLSERLSWYLYAEVSDKRPNYAGAQAEMKELCMKCHTQEHTDEFYRKAEAVVLATNEKVKKGADLYAQLKKEGLLTKQPFDEPMDFLYFDFWHYFGRTAKHGAFMGGADYTQWHGNYELLYKMIEMEEMAAELRSGSHAN